MSVPVIAIFDIGKTNKKVFLFDEDYGIRYEHAVELPETKDEDGFLCEDIHLLSQWVANTFHELRQKKEFDIRALNFSAHGASFVHLDDSGKIITPLYNYLKPYPDDLRKKFYDTYGGEAEFPRVTASPVLGNLNSGMQLYWLKHARPEIFSRIRYSLHLPEYLSYLFTGKPVSGITSIGCHTNLWDFTRSQYHQWVQQEEIFDKLAPVVAATEVISLQSARVSLNVGIGLHDSSAALIPYLALFNEPFVLISTGTWSVSLNPFNHSPLTEEELKHDCLCYLGYDGKPVKASRFFISDEHDRGINSIAEYFHVNENFYRSIVYSPSKINERLSNEFTVEHLKNYSSCEDAYIHFMCHMVNLQANSTNRILKNSPAKMVFVDGGFSQNSLYMHLLAEAYPQTSVCAATVAQASSVGAAMAIHAHWNHKPVQKDIIQLQVFPNTNPVP